MSVVVLAFKKKRWFNYTEKICCRILSVRNSVRIFKKCSRSLGLDLLDRLRDLSINHLYINLSKHKVKLSKNIRFIFNATKNRLLWWSLIILWLRLSGPQSVGYKQLLRSVWSKLDKLWGPHCWVYLNDPTVRTQTQRCKLDPCSFRRLCFFFFDVYKFLFQH